MYYEIETTLDTFRYINITNTYDMMDKTKIKNQVITFRLTLEERERLSEVAKLSSTSVGELIRFCLKPVLVTKQNQDGGK